jgi:SAM-dependent methyltransferase
MRNSGFLCFAPTSSDNSADYDPAHFPLLVAVEDRSFWFRERNRLILWALRRYFGTARQIIEVGVGTGYVMRAIRQEKPEAELYGSDIHIDGLRHAAGRLDASVELIQMDARRIPFREHFDLICAFDVLEHIREDQTVLEEMRRALRPGGGILLTVPQHMFLWSPADEAACHERRYRTGELVDKVRAAGFEIIRKTSFVSTLLPAMYLSRMRARSSGRYDLAGELRTGGVANTLMGYALRAETALILAGIALPAGGSQLLAAVKRS